MHAFEERTIKGNPVLVRMGTRTTVEVPIKLNAKGEEIPPGSKAKVHAEGTKTVLQYVEDKTHQVGMSMLAMIDSGEAGAEQALTISREFQEIPSIILMDSEDAGDQAIVQLHNFTQLSEGWFEHESFDTYLGHLKSVDEVEGVLRDLCGLTEVSYTLRRGSNGGVGKVPITLILTGQLDPGPEANAEAVASAIKAEALAQAAQTQLTTYFEGSGVPIAQVTMTEDGLVYGAAPKSSGNGERASTGGKVTVTVTLKNNQTVSATGTRTEVGEAIAQAADAAGLNPSDTDLKDYPGSWVGRLVREGKVPTKWAINGTWAEA
jgi:hypothetical protein